MTAHRPSAVSHAVTAAFTGPDDLNLIVAKSTRLEVHAVDGSGEGLRPLLDVPLYGRVATLEVWRPHGAGHPDLIFLSTERYRFALLAYDAESGEASAAPPSAGASSAAAAVAPAHAEALSGRTAAAAVWA